MLEPLHHDKHGPYLLRWPCYGCGCLTVPVDKNLLDANDQAAITSFHRCQVCGHAVQLPRDMSDLFWELSGRARVTRDWLALDDEPLRQPWATELPGLDDERLRYGNFRDWRSRVRKVRRP
ncbi:MAG: hypothetical protein JWL76_1963 [Thermoleophilia bacterium]|nr:hypothetical protein [Thermoleophilia bacterium]